MRRVPRLGERRRGTSARTTENRHGEGGTEPDKSKHQPIPGRPTVQDARRHKCTTSSNPVSACHSDALVTAVAAVTISITKVPPLHPRPLAYAGFHFETSCPCPRHGQDSALCLQDITWQALFNRLQPELTGGIMATSSPDSIMLSPDSPISTYSRLTVSALLSNTLALMPGYLLSN